MIEDGNVKGKAEIPDLQDAERSGLHCGPHHVFRQEGKACALFCQFQQSQRTFRLDVGADLPAAFRRHLVDFLLQKRVFADGQDLFVQDFCQGQTGLFCQRMTRCSDEHRLLRMAAGQHAVFALQRVTHGERQIDLPPGQHAEQVGRDGGNDGDRDIRILLPVFLQRGEQQRMQDGFHDADAQCAADLPLFRIAQVCDLLRELCYLLGIRDKLLSCRRKHVPLSDPLEQRRSDLLFQLMDLRRDRGRRITQLFRCFRKAAELRDPQKCVQVSEFHVHAPYHSILLNKQFETVKYTKG